MGTWIAVGDETGRWDIRDGEFDSQFTGVAWVLGSAEAWESAMRGMRGSLTVKEAFSQQIQCRMPAGVTLASQSDKYHVLDIWNSLGNARIDVSLDEPQQSEALEILRGDAEWLLRDSGLGVLVVGGKRADAKAAGLWYSGDGMRERARAFSSLMAVALPFLPGDDDLYLTVEQRSEDPAADAVRFNVGAMPVPETGRYAEPFRDFLGRLGEDVRRLATRCEDLVANGTVVHSIFTEEVTGLVSLFHSQEELRTLRHHSETTLKAMIGIADLAAALLPRTSKENCRLIVPDGYRANLYTANYRELCDVIPV